ncbi:MAG: histidine phosphatase family protein [Oscillospiraceae bacterium]|nr:histidine phosphatase family protein [Oscillospiraceae bacterium]
MKLYVTRHGQTEWNTLNRICGSTDVPLSEEGIRQAGALAEKCAACGDIDRIIASPMRRAQMTAQIVSQRIGIAVQTDERLREWNYGALEGGSRFVPELDEVKMRWGCKAPGGGESVFQLVQRSYNAIDDVKRLYPGENVLFVCHGGISRIIDSYFHDMTMDRFMHYLLDNCELKVYEWE